LAFTRSVGDKTELVKVRLGSVDAPVVLTEFQYDYVPQWSPTGEWITCPLPEGFGIISPNGKTSRLLYKNERPFTFWSKDGRTLYGVTRKGSQAILKAVTVAGGAERVVGDLGQDFPASWAVPSIRLSLAPDGNTFAYAVVRQRWDLWMLEGFEPPPGPLGRLLRTLRLRN
jgi:Tol biopolymer transport system component